MWFDPTSPVLEQCSVKLGVRVSAFRVPSFGGIMPPPLPVTRVALPQQNCHLSLEYCTELAEMLSTLELQGGTVEDGGAPPLKVAKVSLVSPPPLPFRFHPHTH